MVHSQEQWRPNLRSGSQPLNRRPKFTHLATNAVRTKVLFHGVLIDINGKAENVSVEMEPG